MAKKIEIEIGKVYGNWLVLEEVSVEGRNQKYVFNSVAYKVQCQLCRKSTSIKKASILIKQRVKQCKECGFKNRFQHNKKDVGELSLGFYNRIKRDALSRNLVFGVTQEFLWSLFQRQLGECALTGKTIEFSSSYNSKDRTASLDRIDSSKGYVEGNVQWVHRDINQMKWNFSQEDFLQRCAEVIAYKNQGFNKYKRTEVIN